MFSTDLGLALEAAFREASSRRHAFFCVEHVLYALSFNPKVVEVLEACDADLPVLRRDLEKFLETQVETVADGHGEGTATAQEPVQTPAVQRVLQRAILHMRSAQRDVITPVEVLVAVFSEEDSHAVYFLSKHDISRLDVLNYVAHGITKNSSSDDYSSSGDEEDEDLTDEPSLPKRSVLELFADNLTLQAKQGELDPIIGRDAELQRTLKILCRRQKNNPLFVGEPGVGKSAMAHAVAMRLASDTVPKQLEGAEVFSVNIGSLLAGTKFRGEFEDRLRRLLGELGQRAKPILFIDEIHTIVGAGATGSGSLDAANLLKPAMAKGSIRFMGSTTHNDYKKSFDKDRALSRRFSVVELREPTIEETVEILQGLKGKYEEYHSVRYSSPALRTAAELSAKHINERFLPDKAIDVIDEAGAANALLGTSKRKKILGEAEIEAIVAAVARVPIKSVSRDDEDVLRELEKNLKAQVYGQLKAVEAVTRAIKRGRASLKPDRKPVGSFLFAGPTGVGKTELAKVLAKELGVQFHRFDMSEYMEKHAVSRLIGAPPGYVGYEEGGQLTDLVRKHPYAVLLFDEIEKAHQDIYNILLQILDDASLTDSQGRKTDFRNVIIILTTNAGSEKSGTLGFGNSATHSFRDEAIKRTFKPEFRNRLDEIVYFNPLPPEVVAKVVDKFVKELEDQLKERGIRFSLSDAARDWLAKKGFDVVLGARPMARIIQRELKDPLADEILFGKLKGGGEVRVDIEVDTVKLSF